jgi:DNA repair photolyase
MKLQPIYCHEPDVYHIPGFTPQIVDRAYFEELGVTTPADDDTIDRLVLGSKQFIARLAAQTAIPSPNVTMDKIALDSELEIHNYTACCPTLTYEVTPVKGCMVGCMYCLVTDGVHEQSLVAYDNYHELLHRFMETHRDKEHYYYFSAKTEAFHEATLQTGIAHNILRAFVEHYAKYPDSKARLFIASKAGARHLFVEHEGESILDLFCKLRGKMQFNTSLSIMPVELRTILEPYSAPAEERMAAVRLCQENGVLSNSALVQPIVPSFLTKELTEAFFAMLQKNNIVNFKPEFMTVCMENLAWIGQLLGTVDKTLERELYDFYIAPENKDHRKQRGRTAPNRDFSLDCIRSLMQDASQYGISTSICYWVRKTLDISEEMIPIINENGFQCLGYQRKLFEELDACEHNQQGLQAVCNG